MLPNSVYHPERILEVAVMNLLWLKVLFMAVIFALAVGLCVAPIVLMRRRNVDKLSPQCRLFLSFCNCVAGGVFLAMCFLDMLPCVQEQVDTILFMLSVTTMFPITETVVVLGFFLILTIEQASLAGFNITTSNNGKISTKSEVNGCHEQGANFEMEHSYNGDDVRCPLLEAEEVELYNAQSHVAASNGSQKNKTLPQHSENGNADPHNELGNHSHHAHGLLLDSIVGRQQGVKAVILLLALSVHGVFEGIALGLQDDLPKLLNLFLAIALHESICAVALGLNVAKLKPSTWTVIRFTTLLSVSIPIGIGIGIAVGQAQGLTGHIVSGVLQGIAAGIFLHITFMQLIPAELGDHTSSGLIRVLFLFIGFVFLAIVKLATREMN